MIISIATARIGSGPKYFEVHLSARLCDTGDFDAVRACISYLPAAGFPSNRSAFRGLSENVKSGSSKARYEINARFAVSLNFNEKTLSNSPENPATLQKMHWGPRREEPIEDFEGTFINFHLLHSSLQRSKKALTNI